MSGKTPASSRKTGSSKQPSKKPTTTSTSSAYPDITSNPVAPKVQIPRLVPPAHQASTSKPPGDKNRVDQACENCRQKKVKCNGAKPKCSHCENFDLVCDYQPGLRKRKEQEFTELKKRTALYSRLLEESRSRLDPNIWDQFQKDKDLAEAASGASDAQEHGDESPSYEEDGDLDKETQTSGYVGQMSHSFWASSLRTYLGEMQQKSLARQSQPFPGSSDLRNLTPRVAHAPGSATIPESEGPLDNIIPINSPVDNHVPSQVADHLLDIYARLILPVFPIVGGLELRGLVESSTTKGKTYGYECSLKLNLVFAIASRHLLVVHENNLSGGLPNPSVFFSRAYHQNQSPDHFYMEPSLSQVQIAGLTAFYLICINQIDRAWSFCGLALRSSMALGFHVRSHNREFTDDGGTDIRQVWWAIFSLESFLEKMTGHPGSFLRDVTPFILEPEPNFLNAYTRLMCLTHEMIDQVYRPDPNLRSENQMRTTVLEFNNKLEDWARNLPGDLIFISKQPREGFNNPQMYLAFAYYSSQMVLFRPLDLLRDSQQPSKASPISNISRASGTAARQMMSLLPEVKVVEKTPGYESTLKLSPWYCLIQYLLQAITVLMIEMVATRDDSERIQAFDAAIRSLRWLHILTKNHGPGSGSYRQADILLRHATSYLGLSLPLDLPPSPSELGSDEIHVHGDEYFHPHLNRPGDVPMYGSAGDFTGTNNPFPRSSYHESMEYDMEPEDTATGGFLQSYGYETFG